MKLLKVLLLCLFSFVTLQIIAEKKASYVQNPQEVNLSDFRGQAIQPAVFLIRDIQPVPALFNSLDWFILLLIPVVLLIVSLSSRLYLHKLFDQEKVFLRYKIFLWQKRYSCFTLCCMLNYICFRKNLNPCCLAGETFGVSGGYI